MRRVLLAFGVLAALAVSASAAPIVLVDHFSDGDFLIAAKTGSFDNLGPTDFWGNPMKHTGLKDVIGAGGVPPGERDVTVNIIVATDQFQQAQVGSHMLACSVTSGAQADFILTYGTYASLGTPLNANAFESTFLGFDVTQSDQGGTVVVDLNTWQGFYSTPALSIPAGGMYFALPNFSFIGMPQSALSDVDGIKFTFYSSNQAWDFGVDAIQFTTPEPATLSLLGLGILALVRRRRKS